MRRFENGLLYTSSPDVAPGAFEPLVEGAVNHGMRVTVATSVRPRRWSAGLMAKGISREQVVEGLVEDARAKLEAFAEPYRSAGLDTRTEVLVGDPVDEVVRCVVKNGHDLLVKPSEGSFTGDSATVGGLDFRFVRSVPAPVFIIRTMPPQSIRRVVATLECGRTEPKHEALNQEILDVAAGISLFGFHELHLLHAWDLWGEQLLRSPKGGRPSQEVDELVRAERRTREEWLEGAVRDFIESLPSDQRTAFEPKLHLVKGLPREVIATVVRELDPQLLVMGTIARTGLQGFVLGNTAEALLRETEVSVMVVKPPDFIPPGG